MAPLTTSVALTVVRETPTRRVVLNSLEKCRTKTGGVSVGWLDDVVDRDFIFVASPWNLLHTPGYPAPPLHSHAVMKKSMSHQFP